MPREKKADREAYVHKRARELARSGEYSGWRIIETILRVKEDYPEARQWLDSKVIRRELDDLCAQSRTAKPDA